MAGEDFVHVRLTAAGEQMAGAGGYVRIAAGSCDFTFRPGQTQRVTRAFDWNKILRDERFNGQPVFEIVATPENEEPATDSATDAAASN